MMQSIQMRPSKMPSSPNDHRNCALKSILDSLSTIQDLYGVLSNKYEIDLCQSRLELMRITFLFR